MSTQREEVVVSLGIDNSAIEKGLHIGENYFEKWHERLKSQETQYSNWWNAELKKREEDEVAASVRAATRSNQARRLLRQRNEDRNERINQEIGAGSIPENLKQFERSSAQSWSGWGKRGGSEIKESAKFIKKEFGAAFGEAGTVFKGIMMASIATIAVGLGIELINAWKKFTAWGFDFAFNQHPADETNARILDINRRNLRADREQATADRAAAAAKAVKDLEDQKRWREKMAAISDESHKREFEYLGGSGTLAGLQYMESLLQKKKAAAQADYDASLKQKDQDVRLDAELKLETAKLDLEKAQADVKSKKAELDKKSAEATQKHNAELARQKDIQQEINGLKNRMGDEFTPTIQELAESGYWTGRGRRRRFVAGTFSGLANAELDLQNEIKQDVIWGEGRDPEKVKRLQDIRDRLKSAGVYEDPNQGTIDAIEKLQKEGLPVTALPTDDTN